MHCPSLTFSIFEYFPETTARILIKIDRELNTQLPLPSLCFWADQTKLAFDWLIPFLISLSNAF